MESRQLVNSENISNIHVSSYEEQSHPNSLSQSKRSSQKTRVSFTKRSKLAVPQDEHEDGSNNDESDSDESDGDGSDSDESDDDENVGDERDSSRLITVTRTPVRKNLQHPTTKFNLFGPEKRIPKKL